MHLEHKWNNHHHSRCCPLLSLWGFLVMCCLHHLWCCHFFNFFFLMHCYDVRNLQKCICCNFFNYFFYYYSCFMFVYKKKTHALCELLLFLYIFFFSKTKCTWWIINICYVFFFFMRNLSVYDSWFYYL